MIQLTIPVYLIKCHHREILSTDDDEWCEECMRWTRADHRLVIGVEWDRRYGIMTEIVSQMATYKRRKEE